MTITVEEMPTKKAGKPEAAKSTPARPMLDAERFSGQPFTQYMRLAKAMDELTFFYASGRHHTERETNEVRSHTQWRREAEALCLALRDAIAGGLLEPVKPKRTEDDE